jgi:hypothetical protein
MTFWFMLSANVNTEFDDDFLHLSSKGVPEILVHKQLYIYVEQASLAVRNRYISFLFVVDYNFGEM